MNPAKGGAHLGTPGMTSRHRDPWTTSRVSDLRVRPANCQYAFNAHQFCETAAQPDNWWARSPARVSRQAGPRLHRGNRAEQHQRITNTLWRTSAARGSTATALPPMDCKSIAKASMVRILHLPPRAGRALDLRKRRSWALSCCPGHQPSPLTLWGWSCPPMSWCLRSVAVRSWASRGRGPAGVQAPR